MDAKSVEARRQPLGWLLFVSLLLWVGGCLLLLGVEEAAGRVSGLPLMAVCLSVAVQNTIPSRGRSSWLFFAGLALVALVAGISFQPVFSKILTDPQGVLGITALGISLVSYGIAFAIAIRAVKAAKLG